MKALDCMLIIVLFLFATCLAVSQTAKYETSKPYSQAIGYLITDSTMVRAGDSLTVFAPFPKEFCETAKLAKKLEPYFPEDLLNADVEGDIVAVGYLDSSGVVRKAQILSSTERRFNKHALFALIQWQFDPLKATNVWVKVPFRFRIMKSN